MSGSLLSSSWHRVADRRPKLRPHARLYRHRYRGETWYLLQDPASSRVHRFTPAARFLIALMNGHRRVAELWELANKHLGDDAPTQDEVIELLGQLHGADLLQSDVNPDVAELFARHKRQKRARYRRSFGNPMAIRIPLWDPDKLLNRFEPLLKKIWGSWGAIVWLIVVVPAFLLVPPHWPELTNNFTDRVLAVESLISLYLVFPVLKVLHELGHATAIKARGGEVHDMGIIILVLLPIPYVEASAATVLPSKYQRALVGVAGMAVELFVAAIAFYVWMVIEPGTVRAVLFHIMLIASISTIVFNGNPLLRYDAYYILADLIEIPNLATRSTRYWGYVFERYFFGVAEAEAPSSSRGEKAWFLFYGVASALYRVLVMAIIALFVATRFFIIGVLLALWAVIAMVCVPVFKAVRNVMRNPRIRKRRLRSVSVTVAAAAALGALLFVVPVPSHSIAEGVMWLPEDATVRADGNGFLENFRVRSGTKVARGSAIAQLYDPVLGARLHLHEATLAELRARYASEFVTDHVRASIVREQIAAELGRGALLRERESELLVHAGVEGVFIAPQMDDLPGRYFRKGDLVGYVIGKAQPIARVVVGQDSVDRVRLGTHEVNVRLVDRPETTYRGKVIREVPAGEEYLPSRALATEGGGEIVIDPRDTAGVRAMQRMFQFDVEIEGMGPVDYFGQRVFVRFQHQPEPLASQWYRSIRLLILSVFDV
jgi:putative peptide zinc metalloprotease protein